MDYDLDIILIAHFQARVEGRSPLPIGQFAADLFNRFNSLTEARLPGRSAEERSAIAVLAFLAPAQTASQAADMAIAEFIAVNT